MKMINILSFILYIFPRALVLNTRPGDLRPNTPTLPPPLLSHDRTVARRETRYPFIYILIAYKNKLATQGSPSNISILCSSFFFLHEEAWSFSLSWIYHVCIPFDIPKCWWASEATPPLPHPNTRHFCLHLSLSHSVCLITFHWLFIIFTKWGPKTINQLFSFWLAKTLMFPKAVNVT